jgi:hypothetical protein
MPGRPWGFAPQIAMALFAGAVVKQRSLAFAFPLLSMFLSDLLYHALFLVGLTPISGFYSGQWENYLLLTSLTVIGFTMTNLTISRIAAGSVVGPTVYFLLSNLSVWMSGGGYQRPKTFEGLLMCLADGIPFYQMSLLSTAVFSTILFGSHHLMVKRSTLTTA